MTSNEVKPAKTIMEYLDLIFLRLIGPSKKDRQPIEEELRMAEILATKRAQGKALAQGGWDKHCVYFYPVGTSDVTVDEISVQRWKAVLCLLLLKIWAAAFYKASEMEGKQK